MIIPVYKKIGQSTHLLAKSIGKKIFQENGDKQNLKATHTGTLDPMAEGVVVVLTGKDRFLKEKISSTKKTYVFEVLWGISTDSYDLLGLITKKSKAKISQQEIEEKLKKEIATLSGKMKQRIPDFSARRINGKSFFDQAKNNISNPKIYQQVEVFDVKPTSFSKITSQQLNVIIEKKINLVEGDFRQKEILHNWKKDLFELEKEGIDSFLISKIKISTSKRFYVRGLVRDLSKKIAIPATAFSITRTQNGKYQISDCEVKYSYE